MGMIFSGEILAIEIFFSFIFLIIIVSLSISGQEVIDKNSYNNDRREKE